MYSRKRKATDLASGLMAAARALKRMRANEGYGPLALAQRVAGGSGGRWPKRKKGRRFTGSVLANARRGGQIRSMNGRRRRYRKGRLPARWLRRYIKQRISYADNDEDINTFRNRWSSQIECELNECVYNTFTLGHRDYLDEVIQDTKITDYDPATELIEQKVVDLDDQHAQTRRIRFLGMKMVGQFRNNGSTPMYMEVYWFRCQRSCNGSALQPYNCWLNSMTNKGAGAGYDTDTRYNIYDGKQLLSRFWKQTCYKKYLLNAGDELTLSLSNMKPFWYNPTDSENQDFLRGIAVAMIIRTIGVVSHDSETTTSVGTCNGTIDYIFHSHTKYVGKISAKTKWLKVGDGDFDAQTVPIVDGPPVEELKEEL